MVFTEVRLSADEACDALHAAIERNIASQREGLRRARGDRMDAAQQLLQELYGALSEMAFSLLTGLPLHAEPGVFHHQADVGSYNVRTLLPERNLEKRHIIVRPNDLDHPERILVAMLPVPDPRVYRYYLRGWYSVGWLKDHPQWFHGTPGYDRYAQQCCDEGRVPYPDREHCYWIPQGALRPVRDHEQLSALIRQAQRPTYRFDPFHWQPLEGEHAT